MCLTKGEFEYYKPQLERLSKKSSNPSFKFLPQHKIFIVLGDSQTDTVAAYAVLGKPHGHWYFRNCVVDRKHRGKGLQRELIQQRLDYIANNGGGNVSVGIDPKNTKSLNNMLSFGFKFKKGGLKHNENWYQKLYRHVDAR